MFNKLFKWIGEHALGLIVFAMVTTCLWTIASLVDVVRKPPSIENFKDNIVHNHLVWSVKGECFFVRPYSSETVYLIRVQDCDKIEKVGK